MSKDGFNESRLISSRPLTPSQAAIICAPDHEFFDGIAAIEASATGLRAAGPGTTVAVACLKDRDPSILFDTFGFSHQATYLAAALSVPVWITTGDDKHSVRSPWETAVHTDHGDTEPQDFVDLLEALARPVWPTSY